MPKNEKQVSRRQWLAGAMMAGLAAPGLTLAARQSKKTRAVQKKLALEDYEPKSMLHVPENKVLRARFPVIDIHTHLSRSSGAPGQEKVNFSSTPEQLLRVMDRKNLRIMVNLTGGYGAALDETLRYWRGPAPERFAVFTEPWFNKIREANYPQFQADQIERAHRLGAGGIKILKFLGLYLRENITSGPLVKIDDRRFDPMWEAAGAHRMPVAIHTSDPEAFFLPIDRYNERYEELQAHPDWSFHGKDYPSNMELQEARLRIIARHPRTQFIALHVADAENLPYVASCLDKYPNMQVEIAARIGELGRQPRQARKFFDRYQDRILFGTDAVPGGDETPQQVFGERLYEIYFRFLETEDEYFDYAPSVKPPQGRWRISGLGLPDDILRKVYHQNAERLLNLEGA